MDDEAELKQRMLNLLAGIKTAADRYAQVSFASSNVSKICKEMCDKYKVSEIDQLVLIAALREVVESSILFEGAMLAAVESGDSIGTTKH